MGGVPSLRLSDGGCLLWGLCCACLICGPCQAQMGLSQWPQPCRASVPAIITYDMQMGHLFPASPGHAAPPYQDSGAALVGSSEGAGPRRGRVLGRGQSLTKRTRLLGPALPRAPEAARRSLLAGTAGAVQAAVS